MTTAVADRIAEPSHKTRGRRSIAAWRPTITRVPIGIARIPIGIARIPIGIARIPLGIARISTTNNLIVSPGRARGGRELLKKFRGFDLHFLLKGYMPVKPASRRLLKKGQLTS